MLNTIKTSRIKEFYKLSRDQRLNLLCEFADLSDKDIELLKLAKLDDEFELLENSVENSISVFPISLGLATNFIINGKDYLIPMATEEASVIAGASNAAKLTRSSGGFVAMADKSVMIGQIHLVDIKNICAVKTNIEKNKAVILELANKQDPVLVNLGGGAFDLELRELKSGTLGDVLAVHVLVDTKDAMGANAVNTMCEAIAPMLTQLTGCTVLLRILSNLSVYRMARSQAVWSKDELDPDLINKIIQANQIAKIDIFRAATHNKGIMNGIDAVCIATGNDFRAVEAGVHAYAAMQGAYGPLTDYFTNEQGDLVGVIDIPLAVGIIGGATQKNPFAKLCLKILDVKTAGQLAQIIASVGLAQNFAALKALVSEGIQKGHMRLHKKIS